MRSLSPEEAELWERVTASIRPLSREPVDDGGVKKPASTPIPKPSAELSSRNREAAAARQPQLGSTLDSSWDRRLRSGAVEPERTIDLHGLNLDSAWRAIDRGLEQAISRRERVVLLITGHQRSSEPPVRRGAIRAAVKDWLAASRHASAIASVRGAHRRHGGGGSLYLILRRR